jgi:hypothetical protein
LKDAIWKVATKHPKLGIGHVQVPSFIIMIKEKLETLKQERKYLNWSEYKEICKEVGIILIQVEQHLHNYTFFCL